MSETPDTYVHGHHESVLRSHTWRTVENSAGYLLDHLTPGLDVLDVGCGPGTITVDIAARVAPGRVLGIDPVAAIVAQASELVEPDITNCEFATGDVYALDFADASYDVVHAHQVLQHLRDPVAALREMRRVTKPGGIVAIRDADYAAMHWAPASARLDTWMDLYHRICAANEVEPDAGRYLLGWAQNAGFEFIEVSSSTWTFATPETKQWWGSLWADRIRQSSFAEQALEHDLATEADLADLAAAFHQWAAEPDAVFVVPHGEILARA